MEGKELTEAEQAERLREKELSLGNCQQKTQIVILLMCVGGGRVVELKEGGVGGLTWRR